MKYIASTLASFLLIFGVLYSLHNCNQDLIKNYLIHGNKNIKSLSKHNMNNFIVLKYFNKTCI